MKNEYEEELDALTKEVHESQSDTPTEEQLSQAQKLIHKVAQVAGREIMWSRAKGAIAGIHSYYAANVELCNRNAALRNLDPSEHFAEAVVLVLQSYMAEPYTVHEKEAT